MNNAQLKHAAEEMTNWLSHPQELGKAPAKIECAGEFDHNELHYYIYKYKKTMLGKWILGVCGGYEGDALEHCGHVFSEMEEYSEKTAEEQAKALVNTVMDFWKKQAAKAEKKKENAGTFLNFVLLEENSFDKEGFLRVLKEEWGVEDDDPNKELNEGSDTVVIGYKGAIVSVALMPAPVPQEEIDYHVAGNYRWKDGAEAVKRQKAHLVVFVLGKQAMTPAEAAKLMVKVVGACCSLKGVVGIYANGTVYQPGYYLDFAKLYFRENMFPLINAVWFGLYRGKGGVCAFTNGLLRLGYDEIEIIDSDKKPEEILSFLSSVSEYIITDNVILRDGETIGFSAEQKLPISKTRGAAVEGESLKIKF